MIQIHVSIKVTSKKSVDMLLTALDRVSRKLRRSTFLSQILYLKRGIAILVVVVGTILIRYFDLSFIDARDFSELHLLD